MEKGLFMSARKIKELMERFRATSILILCHHNADPDALCSAFAFSGLLRRLRSGLKIRIASPEGISKLSKVLLQYIPIDVSLDRPRFEEFDLFVMLDTNTIQQLGDWGEYLKRASKPLIVVDHHASHPETEKLATLYIFDEESSSTCEIVYGLLREFGFKPSKAEAEALFLGMAFDTKHFILAKPSTFKVLAELVDMGVDPQKAITKLSMPMDQSERIARLKACQRVRLVRIGDWILTFTHVGAYQASAARALIELGAHFSFVAGQDGDQIQISLRSSRDFYEKTGLHLGEDLARPLGEYLHGMGGGHATSAGVNGFGEFEDAVEYSMKLIRDKLAR
ncbi:hypothetical protein DRO55_05130 [Candidatus Bathyarchaeota archaeon]|nr:MAG: hypothetical protein DRO55_05130 [Candidatus Bathyarchaeota archaeon]